LTAIVVAFLVSIALQPMVIVAMRRANVIDTPNDRSSHMIPTPRGGGLAVVVAVLSGVALAGGIPLYFSAAVVMFAVIGLVEDLHGLTVGTRLAVQLGAGAAASLLLLRTQVLPIWATVGGVALGAFCLTAYVNVFNFMDGVNGISAVNGTVGGLAYAAVGYWSDDRTLVMAGAVLAAAAAAFLPWNAVRPRIFLGDVGSYAIGAALAALALGALVHRIQPEAALAPLTLYVADTGWTLWRRIQAREHVFRAHRSHVYQRLNIAGWSHLRVASTTGALTAMLSATGLASLTGHTVLRAAADAVAFLILVGYLSVPTLMMSHRSGHAAASLVAAP